MNVGVLLLAAGRSRRFGSDKRAAALADGRVLLRASVDNAMASGLPVRVCLRPGEDTLAAQVDAAGAAVLYCATADAGMGHTLAEGLTRMREFDGVLIALGDMPLIRPETFNRVADALRPGAICQPTWQAQPGHPVGFGSDWFAALETLSGDRGARALVRANADRVLKIPVDDPGILRDIDTPADLP